MSLFGITLFLEARKGYKEDEGAVILWWITFIALLSSLWPLVLLIGVPVAILVFLMRRLADLGESSQKKNQGISR